MNNLSLFDCFGESEINLERVPNTQGDKDAASADSFGCALDRNVTIKPQMTRYLQVAPSTSMTASLGSEASIAGIASGSVVITGAQSHISVALVATTVSIRLHHESACARLLAMHTHEARAHINCKHAACVAIQRNFYTQARIIIEI